MQLRIEPAIKVLSNEPVVVQLRIEAVDLVDSFDLARAHILVWIEAPAAHHQPLSSKYFMTSRDRAAEVVGHVEEGGVAVRNRTIKKKELAIYGLLCANRATTIKDFYGTFCPYRPMSQ